MLVTLLAFVVTLGVLITFHELGHYWVARWCGVRVLRFSIGFGRVLIKRVDRHGTEWALSAIPLGGYVKMLDESDLAPASSAADTKAKQSPESFAAQPVSRRIAIVAAGPIFNLLLAAFLYALLSFVGTEEPAAVLATPVAQSPAANAGLQSGDRITAVDDAPIKSWSELRWSLLQKVGDGGTIELTIEQRGSTLSRALQMPVLADPSAVDPLRVLGLRLATGTPVIRGIVADSVGMASGLKIGDRVLAVQRQGNLDVGQLIQLIQQHADKPLQLEIERDAEKLSITLVPSAVVQADGQIVGRIGIQLGGDPELVAVSYGPIDSVVKGVVKTFDTAWFSLRMMGKMILGEVSVKNISGPVTIADYAGQSAKIGWVSFIGYLALVSVSLGVLNLLPIPMLDGGHLLYYLIEIVRGSPPPERFMEWGQRIGFGLLSALMALALFNDSMRYLTQWLTP
ncbi:RIP metalloprotease RseP [Alcaligenaceae bacterium LF4-65]|uniref:Zinc metalloprotease n=1 Tax=Zwartia hollandica TaxID=324606 RepID=A0A953N597_9BURK|nr:RIP metalloprotease RseP [Zwartia hollandica]MBZ1349211.1 RIP metalloprotease RseP [Zwartia hollandica]